LVIATWFVPALLLRKWPFHRQRRLDLGLNDLAKGKVQNFFLRAPLISHQNLLQLQASL